MAVTDKLQKIENLQISNFQFPIPNFSPCKLHKTPAATQKRSNLKWKENEQLVLRNGAEFFLEMKETTGLRRTQTKKQHDRRYHAHERGVESWSRGPLSLGPCAQSPY
jgi:hypothetical protein